ncbi:MAG: phosphate ABC transporter ATP-binding protein [Hadesarchaea archaeon]|nr:MAG: phosphate ABC transporter ATP-binding protein [Hadesarchaea archaeon]
MNVIMELKKVTREYEGKSALCGINLKIKHGEVFSLIGPNGAGKTTLLRIMAFLDKPTNGKIIYKGKEAWGPNLTKYRKKVTMVFQRPLFFNSTVFDNIAYGLKLRGYSSEEIEQKVDNVLRLVKMEDFQERSIKKISGGEQQRVAMARAIALNPELLLLDEPTANLDPANTKLIEKIIKKISKITTVVVATHNLFQAKRLSDRIGCLLSGRLIDVGNTRDIFSRPRDERTKKFVRGEFF